MPEEDTVPGAPPPATSEAIGGQIDETTFLGVRTTGPYAGMLLANNLSDEGLAQAVADGTLVPSSPVEQLFPEGPPDPPEPPEPRVPTITSFAPESAEYTVTELTLYLIGTDFAEGDTVFADDLEATTVTVVGPDNITAFFETILVESPRTVAVKVVTSEDQESNSLDFPYVEPEVEVEDEGEGEDTTEGGV